MNQQEIKEHTRLKKRIAELEKALDWIRDMRDDEVRWMRDIADRALTSRAWEPAGARVR